MNVTAPVADENGQQGYPAGMDGGSAGVVHHGAMGSNNEFNITNFMYDANADWFVNGAGR